MPEAAITPWRCAGRSHSAHDGSEIRPHRDHGRCNDAGGGSASSAPTKITARARPPRTGPKQLTNGVEQIPAMPLRSRISPIRVKNGNGEQRIVLHDAEDAQRQGLQQGFGQGSEFDADEGKEQAAGAEAGKPPESPSAGRESAPRT